MTAPKSTGFRSYMPPHEMKARREYLAARAGADRDRERGFEQRTKAPRTASAHKIRRREQ